MGINDLNTTIGMNDSNMKIKQPDYDNLILELNDNVDKIEMILRNIEMKIHDTEDYLKGDLGDALRTKFETYFQQIETYKNNLLTFSTDLIKIRDSLNNNDRNIVVKLNEYATGLNAEAKEIYVK